jgi:5-oxoprolinase (ATP-hydrolysing)
LCDGVLRDVRLKILPGLLDPPRHEDPAKCAAVVAGNVETSQRVVDVLLGALQVAAASQGTMNNLLIGDSTFGYYETIGGGSGATSQQDGADAVHTHMTNTRITDPEVLESRIPVRLHRFCIRRGSGGRGIHRGGDGMIREIEFLRPLVVSLITSRRTEAPYGMSGGHPGLCGENRLVRGGQEIVLPSTITLNVQPGDRLILRTPGGGGWGTPPSI